MKITVEYLKKLEEFNNRTLPLGFRKRKGRYFIREAKSTRLDFTSICNNLDYLERKINTTNSSFLKFKYTIATKVLLDLVEEGKHGGKVNHNTQKTRRHFKA